MHHDNVPYNDLPREVTQIVPSNRSSTGSSFLFQAIKPWSCFAGDFCSPTFTQFPYARLPICTVYQAEPERQRDATQGLIRGAQVSRGNPPD
jgi:hypothetical protein